jgi:hypothetical protein
MAMGADFSHAPRQRLRSNFGGRNETTDISSSQLGRTSHQANWIVGGHRLLWPAMSPESVRGLRPPIGADAIEPVSRRRFTHFGTQDGSMPNALPIDRIVSPASNRAKARSRRSSE